MRRGLIIRLLSCAPAALLGGCGESAPPGEGAIDASVADAPRNGTDSAALDAAADTRAANDAAQVAPRDGGDAGTLASFGVLSLNLHCLKLDGTTFASNEARFAAIADAVRSEDIAVILAQEVCATKTVSAEALLRGALEAATKVPWTSHEAFAHKAWEGTPDEADEGVAVFVRGTLENPEDARFGAQAALTRVAVSATLPSELGALRVTSVHLEVTSATVRAAQAREAAALAVTASDPGFSALVGGDLNDVPGSAPHGAFGAFGFRELSKTSATQIDHVFAHRAANVAVVEARSLFDDSGTPRVSDHDGVLVRVAGGPGERVQATRFVARASADGGFLAIRGDRSPLSWSYGWPSRRTATGVRLVVTELDAGPFAYKYVKDDQIWQLGENLTGQGGADNAATPTFP